MPISPRYLTLLKTTPGLGLPLTVDVIYKTQQFSATIDIYGKVSCCGTIYDSPSGMRADLIKSNIGTYAHLYYNKKSLRDWGVF